jgi:hypothetical protein
VFVRHIWSRVIGQPEVISSIRSDTDAALSFANRAAAYSSFARTLRRAVRQAAHLLSLALIKESEYELPRITSVAIMQT